MEASAPCPPINTTRLKPFRQALNSVSMAITDSGHVIMKLKSRVTGQSESPAEITKKLVCVSPDGRQIEVYCSAEDVPLVDECHVSCQLDQVYTYPNFPDKLWKKYQHAHKFVEVIKSRTAKVTLITDRARCKLMENSPSPDFQACFPDGVTLVLSKLKVTITDQNGSSLTFHEDLAGSHVSTNTVSLVEYSQQCRDLCLKIEQSVSNLAIGDSDQDLFPITVGTSIQPCLMSDHPLASSPRPDQISHNTPYQAADVWASRPDQTSVLLHLDHAYTAAKSINQPTYLELSHDSAQAVNNFQSNTSEQQFQDGCVYEHRSKLCAANNLQEPYKTTDCKNTPQEPNWHSSLLSKAEVYNLVPEKYKQFKDTDGIRSRCLNRTCHSALTTPQKSNIATFSLRPIYSKSMVHLEPRGIDVIENDMQIQAASGEDSNQADEQQDMYRLLQDNSLSYKFKSECNIPQYVNNFGSTSGHSDLSDEQSQLVLSPFNQTIPCDNYFYQHNQAMCSTNIPDFTTSQFQNNFSTPKKSSVPLDCNLLSCNSRYSIKYNQLNESGRYNLTSNAEVDQRCLQNVRRNLFTDQSSKEITSSSLSSSQASILSELSDESSSKNSTSLNISEDRNFYENHNLVPKNQSLAHKNQSLFPDNQMARLQTQMLPSNLGSASIQPSLRGGSSLAAAATQSTPVKVPSIIKSVLRYSECPGTPLQSQAEILHLNVSLGQSSTQSSNPTHTHLDDEHSGKSSEINKPTSNNTIPGFDLPVTQQQRQQLIPEGSTSPTKPAPIRKVASLSPLKMSSRILNESRFQKNVLSDQQASRDFIPRGLETILAPHSQSISSSSLSSANSIASYHTIQSRECLANPKPDQRILNQSSKTSSYAVHSCKDSKEFHPVSQTANNWSHVHLPFLPHVRHSLDVSSDGYSSPPSSASDVISQVFVPYTGWASCYATGTVWILYNDGTQLGVKSTEAIMIYVDQDGSRTRYSNTDVVPEIVKLKVEKLPKVIDMLMKGQATNFPGPLL